MTTGQAARRETISDRDRNRVARVRYAPVDTANVAGLTRPSRYRRGHGSPPTKGGRLGKTLAEGAAGPKMWSARCGYPHRATAAPSRGPRKQ